MENKTPTAVTRPSGGGVLVLVALAVAALSVVGVAVAAIGGWLVLPESLSGDFGNLAWMGFGVALGLGASILWNTWDRFPFAVFSSGVVAPGWLSPRWVSRAQRLMVAVDALPTGLALYDSDDQLLFCNAAYRAIHGGGGHDGNNAAFAPGRRFEDILRAGLERGRVPHALGRTEEWLQECLQCRRSAMVGGDGGSFELRLADGRWIRESSWNLADRRRVSITQDVTAWKRAIKNLHRSENLLRATVDSSLDPVVAMDERGRLVDYSPAAERVFGHSRASVLGRPVADLLIPEDMRRRHREGLALFLASGHGPVLGQQIELEALHAGGYSIPIELSIAVTRDATHRIFVAYLRDITAQKAAEKRLQREKERAEEARRAEAAFLATISHEIRTPLNGVIGLFRLLQGDPLGAAVADHLRMGRRAAENVLTLLNDFIDFSRAETGGVELDAAPFDLKALIRKTAEELQPVAERKGLAYQVQVDDALPPGLVGDPFHIRLVLVNFLSNAIDFTPQGSILLEALSVESRGDKVRFHVAVTDTGVGIPPHRQPIIFSRFARGERVGRSVGGLAVGGMAVGGMASDGLQGGSGLGLALCKRLIDQMGGDIGFTSELEKGSIFWFELLLPVAAEVPPAEEVQRTHRRPERCLRILVAEDNPVNQLVLQTLLKREGHEVQLVANGRDAVAVAGQQKFDLVLMDVIMPGMDGLEAATAIRALPGLEKLPIIAVTAHTATGFRKKLIAAGMNDCLPKPVDAGELLDRLAVWTVEP